MDFNRTVTVPEETQQPSGEMEFASGPTSGETDDVCKCGAARSQKNVERCLRGHPMPGAVIHPHKRGSISVRRVEQLEAAFTEDYKPQAQRVKMEVSRLARMWELRERVEKFEAGSIEHQRLDQIIRDLVDRLEASRPAPAGGTTNGSQVVIFELPNNHRNPHLAPPHSPDDSALPRENTVSAESSAAVESSQPVYLVPERIVSDGGRKSEIRMRPVTEAEVLECLDLQGDLPRYQRGEIPGFIAYKQTQNWLKSKGGF